MRFDVDSSLGNKKLGQPDPSETHMSRDGRSTLERRMRQEVECEVCKGSVEYDVGRGSNWSNGEGHWIEFREGCG